MYKLKYMPCINQICFLQNKKIEKSLSCQFWFMFYTFLHRHVTGLGTTHQIIKNLVLVIYNKTFLVNFTLIC